MLATYRATTVLGKFAIALNIEWSSAIKYLFCMSLRPESVMYTQVADVKHFYSQYTRTMNEWTFCTGLSFLYLHLKTQNWYEIEVYLN